jgi:hypothetical protein
MSEDVLLRTVIDMAQHMGVLAAHFRPAQAKSGRWLTAVQGDGKGYPDVTLVGPGGVLFRELKADRKYPAPEQRRWLTALDEAGADAGVWRPADLQSGRIEAELRAVRKRVASNAAQ